MIDVIITHETATKEKTQTIKHNSADIVKEKTPQVVYRF
ncbi:hypothetical protein PLUTE_b0573 [Pseudoalteromonas luteoviolacea DSM 6061]|nr:hypothetical protein [Pseudoalteromonas luteoviolacea DSM 6061]